MLLKSTTKHPRNNRPHTSFTLEQTREDIDRHEFSKHPARAQTALRINFPKIGYAPLRSRMPTTRPKFTVQKPASLPTIRPKSTSTYLCRQQLSRIQKMETTRDIEQKAVEMMENEMDGLNIDQRDSVLEGDVGMFARRNTGRRRMRAG
jgi:hypothetical protein